MTTTTLTGTTSTTAAAATTATTTTITTPTNNDHYKNSLLHGNFWSQVSSCSVICVALHWQPPPILDSLCIIFMNYLVITLPRWFLCIRVPSGPCTITWFFFLPLCPRGFQQVHTTMKILQPGMEVVAKCSLGHQTSQNRFFFSFLVS